MRTALRKVGNAVGLIVPDSILDELGCAIGSSFALSVGNGRLIAAPFETDPRAGWAEAAKSIAEAGDDQLVWPEFPNDGDDQLKW